MNNTLKKKAENLYNQYMLSENYTRMNQMLQDSQNVVFLFSMSYITV